MKLSGHDGNQASGDVKAKMIRSQTSIFLEHNILIAELDGLLTPSEWLIDQFFILNGCLVRQIRTL